MFKFTIRELLLLTMVVGLAVGWWVDRNRLVESNRFYFNAFSFRQMIRHECLDRLGQRWPGGVDSARRKSALRDN